MILLGVYDNGELIYSGNVYQLAKKFECGTNTIYVACRKKMKFQYKYEIRNIGKYKPEEDEKIPRPTKQQEKEEYYRRHLTLYGNTVVRKQDEKHLDQLLNDLKVVGFDCEVKTYINHGCENLCIGGTKVGRRSKHKDYILKVKK